MKAPASLIHGFVDSPLGQLHYFETGVARPLLLLPQAGIPHSTLLTLEHEDVYAVTLEDRPEEIAAILRRFLLDLKPNDE